MSGMPSLADLGGRRVLTVDGEPFLVLSLQWDCDSCFSAEEMDPLLPHARAMGCNAAALLLYWNEIEPEEGRYDWAMFDHRIEQARANGLRVVLVWFGAYKNGCLNYTPDWVKRDPARFRRVQAADGTGLANFACPSCRETFAKDRAAIERVFGRLAEVDGERHTVILFQMENETGLLGTDRCRCAECERAFAEGRWTERYPGRAAEAFSASCIAAWVDGLAAAAKAIYPLPVYINCWLAPRARAAVAGRHYPSGGPVGRVLDVYREALRHVDFVSPDIYAHGYRDFAALCRMYSWPGNPLYVAEHSSGPGSRAERNVFYALGEHAAIGFDPWAIDRAHPEQYARPLVHPIDGRWSEEAYGLRDSYVVIRDAMIPIAEAQGSERLRAFVQEPAETAALLDFGDLAVEVSYRHRDGAARGMAVRLGRDEMIVLGVGLIVGFSDPAGTPVAIASVERGRFEGRQWKSALRVRREGTDPAAPFRIVEAGVFRVRLRLQRPAPEAGEGEERRVG
jgi:hypothetical protein